MNTNSAILIAFLAATAVSFTPSPFLAAQEVQWMGWEEANQVLPAKDKKVLLNIYTEWCGWCKRMDHSTFRSPRIAEYINDNFHPIRFDAECKEKIEYQGKTYQFKDNGKRGYHELAAKLLNGRMSLPSVVFMDEEHNLIQCIIGYKSPEEFEQILAYFAGDHYKEVPWSRFKQQYEPRLISND